MPTTRPLVVGHRGAAAVRPENTISSFVRGVADGADVIEFDVHLSADDRVVVIHDSTLDRTAVAGRTSGAVRDLTWPQLQDAELADGERIPTLRDALETITTPIQLEIKAPAAARPAAELALAAGVADRVTFISFRLEALEAVRALDPGLALGVVTSRPTADKLAAVDDLGADMFSVEIPHLDRALVAELQRRGVRVCAWTALTESDVQAAVDGGADLVAADDPRWCRSVLEAAAHAAR